MPLKNPDIYELKEGGGCISFIGLFFMLPGIGIMAASIFPESVANNDDVSPLIAIPFGGIFVAIGAAIAIGRKGLIIDRAKGTLITWWGFPKPLIKTHFQVADFTSILTTQEIRKSKNSSYKVYPIYLEKTQGKPIKIQEKRNAALSRTEAETIAKFLSLTIHDQTSGSLQVRSVDSLDENLKDQYAKGRWSNELPSPPANQKSEIEYDAETLTIQTPNRKLSPLMLIPLLFFIGFESTVFFTFVQPIINESMNDQSMLLLIPAFAFLIVPALVLFFIFRGFVYNRQLIIVNYEGLSVTTHGRKSKFIPKDEIEELFKTGRPSSRSLPLFGSLITARSDSTTITFGNNLPEEEIDYILALSRGILVS